MSKIMMCLHLPEPKIRKRAVRAVQKHKDKTKYTRKHKHKATEIGGLSFTNPWSKAARVGLLKRRTGLAFMEKKRILINKDSIDFNAKGELYGTGKNNHTRTDYYSP